MQLSLPALAQLVGGELERESDATITHLARIEDGDDGALCFLANPRYFDKLYSSNCTAVLVPPDFEATDTHQPILVRVDEPARAFHQLLFFAAQQQPESLEGRQEPHFIHPSARVAEDVIIGPFVYIGENARVGSGTRLYPNVYIGRDAIVGEDCLLHAGAVVAQDCQLGDNCILQAGAVIGSDGFGYTEHEGENVKIPQLGRVRLEDDVEIGANTCIDRAMLGETLIERGVKLDNLVHIAHNVSVGENTFMAAQVGVAGSTKIGKRCQIGGQSGISGHISVADGSKFGAKAGLGKNITQPDQNWRGRPVQPYRTQLKMEAHMRQLPELLERIKALETELEALRAKH
ncbi:MAG: UDP-3-O-(3-hydroxymyristoyl)glucosamine N-acyltransferase [Bacteroidota bacterium]